MHDIGMVADFIKRAAEKTGFRREKYVEKNIPTSFKNIEVLLFYGSPRSEMIMSSLLLHRLRSSKYLIFCSFPGRSGVYPYVDEYWSFHDESAIKKLFDGAVGFDNLQRDVILFQEQQLNKYFENVIDVRKFFDYYHFGFEQKFFEEFGSISYYLPAVSSSRLEFNRAIAKHNKVPVFVHPSRVMRCWNRGKEVIVNSKKEFWADLCKALLSSGFLPVVNFDSSTFEVSDVLESSCVYCREEKFSDVLAAMRTSGCVLDVFSGFSRWASVARTPFVSCQERHLYNAVKEYEIDDLCNVSVPHQYIFSFPTIIEGGHWEELVETIINKIEKFIPTLNRDTWPSTSEQITTLSYDVVRKRKIKKIGARFIKVHNE